METESQPSPPPRPAKLHHWKWLLPSVLAVVVFGLIARQSLHGTTPKSSAGTNIATVAVARVVREDLFNLVTVPAEFRPYLEVDIHAKVSGYLNKINVDIGDRVKAGDLLATLDAPDLVAQLNNAIADEQKAGAACTNANLILSRLEGVYHQNSNLLSQQEIDTAAANDRTATAALAAARADREKSQTLVNYLRIAAPFDGVITRRQADPGALIQAGTASQSLPLLRLSDNYRLRLDFEVSVGRIKEIKAGDAVDVRVESLGNKSFAGVVSRRSEKVDDRTRTMTVEVEIPNPQLELVPGMYANVLLKTERRPQALAIPVEAVSAGSKASVLVISKNDEVEERAVTLGLETPGAYEVLDGLKEGELVVIGSRAQVHVGQKVAPKFTELAATK